MSKQLSSRRRLNNTVISGKEKSGWDEVITDAQKKIKLEQSKITELKRAIKTFEKMKIEGTRFPSLGT